MCRDEDLFLRIWLSYYGGQFGKGNCYIIEHSPKLKKVKDIVRDTDVNVITIPFDEAINSKEGDRYAFDRERFKFISNFTSALLAYYDTVIFNDTDEIYVPDPIKAESLAEYMKKAPIGHNIAGIGIEIFQNSNDNNYDIKTPLFDQRANFIYRIHHSKPHIIKVKSRIEGHGSSTPFLLDPNLYLVHLKYLDEQTLVDRQAFLYDLYVEGKVTEKTRWKFTSSEIANNMRKFASLPEQEAPCHLNLLEQQLPYVIDGNFHICTRKHEKSIFQLTDCLTAESVRTIQAFRNVLPSRFKKVSVTGSM